MREFEQLLPFSQCQSRIDGRNGSNACTVISAVSAAHAGTDLSSSSSSSESLCASMRDGNCAYDDLKISSLLSADEVLDLQPSVGLKEARELFVRSDSASINDLVADLSLQAQVAPHAAACGFFCHHTLNLSLLLSLRPLHYHGYGEYGALIPIFFP